MNEFSWTAKFRSYCARCGSAYKQELADKGERQKTFWGGNFQEQFNHCDLSQGAQGFEFFS
jgi:hypothetical protein